MLTDIKHSQDIGMIESRHRSRLLLKAVQAIGFVGNEFGENLERDIAPESRIPRAINFPHATRTDRSDDLVGTQFCARRQRHA